RDDALEVAVRRQRSVLEATLAPEARGAERVGHGRRGMAYEQRTLQAQRHVFDHAARTGLERGGVGEPSLELLPPSVQASVAAAGLLDLVQKDLKRSRRSRERAQDVEAHDIARALPDRGQRGLPV